MKLKTLTEFIQDARGIHGNKYCYSESVYLGNKNKLTIICPEHGRFEQTPASHIHNKSGCPKCHEGAKKTLTEFIQDAQGVHGLKYDYSESVYLGNKNKLTIICPEHGRFEQTPASHTINKSGCPDCYKGEKKTTSEFIQDSQGVHGLKYDYSESVYLGNKNKLIIICPEHGRFEQTPASHTINKSGCPECGQLKKGNKSSTSEFIKKAQIIHGMKYAYSQVEYINTHVKVKITCLKHGVFEQTPSSHLNKRGCPKCANLNKSLNQAKPKEVFILEATKKHSGKYSYETVDYIGGGVKVKIKCPEHGVFEQTTSSHLNGRGCPKCGNETIKAKLRLGLSEFVERSSGVHGTKYSYEDVVYKNARTKVKITCLEHGVFEQFPTNHLTGQGCPKCFNEIRTWNYIKKYTVDEKLGSKLGTFYAVEFTHEGSDNSNMFSFLKIGITSRSIKERFKSDQFVKKVHLELKMSNLSTALLERAFFNEHPPDFVFPEGFRFDGKTECYKIENFKFEWLEGLEYFGKK